MCKKQRVAGSAFIIIGALAFIPLTDAMEFISSSHKVEQMTSFLSNGKQDDDILELYLAGEPDDHLQDQGLADMNEMLNIPDAYFR